MSEDQPKTEHTAAKVPCEKCNKRDIPSAMESRRGKYYCEPCGGIPDSKRNEAVLKIGSFSITPIVSLESSQYEYSRCRACGMPEQKNLKQFISTLREAIRREDCSFALNIIDRFEKNRMS